MDSSSSLKQIDPKIISDLIIGYSGYLCKQGRNKVDSMGFLTQRTYLDYCISIYFNPVLDKYHKPQDSVGIFVQDNRLAFAIADGVSIIRGTTQNDSGYVAHKLVSNLPQFYFDKLNSQLKKISRELKNKNTSGASTLSLGIIRHEKDTDQIDFSFIGNTLDIGVSMISLGNKLETIQNQSSGYFLSNYRISTKSYELKKCYDIFLSSDGLKLPMNAVKKLIDMNIKQRSSDFIKVIKQFQSKIPDDQSIIIISKTNSEH
ncbi:hypothetical protein GF362_07625 [Candidatus Dojkabacteria bacterium]|nr:hypothetical protein [Candidatus Dojkabacteria bacterium]